MRLKVAKESAKAIVAKAIGGLVLEIEDTKQREDIQKEIDRIGNRITSYKDLIQYPHETIVQSISNSLNIANKKDKSTLF